MAIYMEESIGYWNGLWLELWYTASYNHGMVELLIASSFIISLMLTSTSAIIKLIDLNLRANILSRRHQLALILSQYQNSLHIPAMRL